MPAIHTATDTAGNRWTIRRSGPGWAARCATVTATILARTLNETRRAVREFQPEEN